MRKLSSHIACGRDKPAGRPAMLLSECQVLASQRQIQITSNVLTCKNELHIFQLVSIGTSSIFPYIKGPMVHARFKKKPTIEINPGVTELSDSVDIKLSMGAAEALDRIWVAFLKDVEGDKL